MLQKILIGLFILSLFTASCQKKREESIYLIPKNYEGNVLIIFDQPEGADTLYDGDSRVYKIDTTGVLKTKFSKIKGSHPVHFYLVDPNGHRTPIKYEAFSKSIDTTSNEVICFNIEDGSDVDPKKSSRRYFEVMTIFRQNNIGSFDRNNFMSKYLK